MENRIKVKRKGTSIEGQTKKTGQKKKVHEKTSTHIWVGYFMYLAFRSMYFFLSHKYMKKYTDFRTSITALSHYGTDNCIREHVDSVDNKYLQVLLQLRKMGLLDEKDIQRYVSLKRLCQCYCYYYVEVRFRFLVEWDPNRIITLIWK
jgi:hypothetical protein